MWKSETSDFQSALAAAVWERAGLGTGAGAGLGNGFGQGSGGSGFGL